MHKTLLSQYANAQFATKYPVYQELLAANGAVGAHWAPLFQQLAATSPEQMRHQLEFLDRRIEENGVTYNVYADTNSSNRPWALDPLPLILTAEDWEGISAAVTQRARVIDAALADLYGPQTLLAEGLLPPALVYGQHGYLWPSMGVQPISGHFLHLYAADLARSPDGRWWVIADRTQAPSGAGYALENRLIVSRVFPELFHDQRIQHLASFFRALQDGLASWAPVDDGEQPHIVLLTPGPYNETYFEHAYLSRYLGFPLVEGQDLTVRGDTVYLKTLTGLKRVHVILRRQDDDYCDPLEFRGDSALGIPGLMQVVRAQRVMVSNALGSGILSSGALMGFLPGMSQRLLGEDLLMPSVATWWCGEEPALDYAIKHFDDLVFKGAYPTQRFDTVFGRDLKGADKDAMLQRLRARPQAYVAQEVVNPSLAPVWHRQAHERGAGRIQARSLGLRVYAVATPDGYRVMPGGLARVAGVTDQRLISMQRGGLSKDTWVLTKGTVDLSTLLKPSLTVKDLVHGGSNLTSRVVESLFWLGRYSERFDNTARFLRVGLQRLHEEVTERAAELETLLRLGDELELLPEKHALGDVTLVNDVLTKNAPEAVAAKKRRHQAVGSNAGELTSLSQVFPPADRLSEYRLLQAVHDVELPGSLAADIRRAVWSATQVKERLSVDHWHSINSLQHKLKALDPTTLSAREALVFLDQVMLVSSSLNGFTMDNMTRDDGWRFLVVGRRIERLVSLSTVVRHCLWELLDQHNDGLEWLLELTDSIITYRSRYSRRPELLPVMDLIVFDADNPHAIFFQVMAIQRYLDRLRRVLGETPIDLLVDSAMALQTFDLAGLEVVNGEVPRAACEQLVVVLDNLISAAQKLSDQLAMRYFTHVGDIAQQTLGT